MNISDIYGTTTINNGSVVSFSSNGDFSTQSNSFDVSENTTSPLPNMHSSNVNFTMTYYVNTTSIHLLPFTQNESIYMNIITITSRDVPNLIIKKIYIFIYNSCCWYFNFISVKFLWV